MPPCGFAMQNRILRAQILDVKIELQKRWSSYTFLESICMLNTVENKLERKKILKSIFNPIYTPPLRKNRQKIGKKLKNAHFLTLKD